MRLSHHTRLLFSSHLPLSSRLSRSSRLAQQSLPEDTQPFKSALRRTLPSSQGMLRSLRQLMVILGLTLAAGCSAPQASETAPATASSGTSPVVKAERLENLLVEGKTQVPDSLLITRAGARAIDPNGQQPLDDPLTCLARAAYWEAKGEGKSGMQGIVNVVINRAADPRFPDSLCGVVKQGGETGSCQFSWWCDGRSDAVREPDAYADARDVARQALNHQLSDTTDGALYFHARGSTPYWAKRFVRTARIGQHLFYRN